jgi:hypothetical protein
VFAVLLETFLAGLAMQATIDHATDAGQVAFLELSDSVANRGHATDDFVSWNTGIDSPVGIDQTIPISARRV